MKRFPVYYIPHGGGPWPFMDRSIYGPQEPWERLEHWLRNLSAEWPDPPRAILVISGHWEADPVAVTSHPNPPLLFDYYGFPDDTYYLEYPAPGSPGLALEVRELLEKANIPSGANEKRGLDHGVFIPFMLIYPEARIPIVQLSMRPDLDPAFHIELGRAIAPLRERDVLIVGSGMSYHNLKSFGPAATGPSRLFDEWLTAAVTEGETGSRIQKLIHWREAPNALLAHPREDHLIPLMVVAGAAGEDRGVQIYSDKLMGAKTSGYRFGEPRSFR